jgi:predicted MFS family arabinose efflux permease
VGPPRGNFAVALAGFSAFVDLYATQSLLPLLAHTFQVSPLSASATVSATTIAVALAAPVIGPLTDVFGRTRFMVGAAFGLALATLLGATATTLHQLIAWRFVQGLFMPAIFTATIGYVGDEWAGAGLRVGRPMAAYVTGNVVGGVTGRLAAGLVASRFSWRASFLVLGALGFVAASVLRRALPPSRCFVGERTLAASLRGIFGHLRSPRLVAACVVGFNVLFSMVATFTYVSFYLAAPPFRLGTAALSSIFLVYLAGAVATPAGGRWLDRFGYRAVFAAAIAFAAAGLLLTLIPHLGAVLVGLAMCAGGVFVCQSAASGHVGTVTGRARSGAAGLYVACYYLGGTVGATVPGAIWRAGGWPACVALVVGVQLTTAALALVFWRPAVTTGDAAVAANPAR